MPATPFDSALLGDLFPAGETARLFGDSAEVRAMMLVEGGLALVQGAAGVIPETAAEAIHRASLELAIDPGALGSATALNGVSTPALVAAFRTAMAAPEHAQFLHWGATSQDIQDSGLMLRLRQALVQQETRLRACLSALALQASAYAETPMAGRTYGQHATPTSYGAMVASWGWPLIAALDDLPRAQDNLWVSLSGAAGTSSALGPNPAELRAELAQALGLHDPGRSWHSDRTPLLTIADWFAQGTRAAGKIGEDLILAVQSGQGEVRLGTAGSSSTMPHKQNPVAPSVLVALARHSQGLLATLQGAALHRQQRDGSAWFTEWLVLPQLVLTSAAALTHVQALAEAISPDPAAMRAGLEANGGFILSEALSFELARKMPRPEAQAEVKALCKTARDEARTLEDVTRAAHPEMDARFFDPAAHTGHAPQEARAFASAVATREV